MSMCPGLSYASQLVGRSDKGGFTLVSETQRLNDVESFFVSGFSCADILPAIPSLMAVTWKLPVADGEVIVDPGFNAASLLGVDLGTFSSFGINVTIDGVNRGSFGWTLSGGTTVVYSNDTSPAVNFPLTAGVDFLTISFSSVGGIGCDGVAWNPTQSIAYFADQAGIDAWFCCATSAHNCCGSPPAAAPKFLIPPSGSPAPGEENATTPVLNKAIYLSNYTFQFVNNFGRVPKQ